MHLADQLFVEAFEVQIEASQSVPTTVEALAYIAGGF